MHVTLLWPLALQMRGSTGGQRATSGDASCSRTASRQGLRELVPQGGPTCGDPADLWEWGASHDQGERGRGQIKEERPRLEQEDPRSFAG